MFKNIKYSLIRRMTVNFASLSVLIKMLKDGHFGKDAHCGCENANGHDGHGHALK